MLLSPGSPSGYDSQWPEVADKSGMHIGYAIQWAAFALIALGTFIGLNLKRVKQ
jgi:surfeit locus 1 family protein